MVIKEIKAKQILTKSGIPNADYVINPYVGCQHACVWCYARFMKRFTNHSEKWGEFVDVKINAPEILAKELAKIRPENIFMSSVTDCYQPIEHKYKLTRKILDILSDFDIPVSILTESILVLRDMDILKKFKNIQVGFTIVSDNDKINRLFQPYSALPSQRIKALEKLSKEGIKTYVHLGPILPRITNLESIFQKISGKVEYVMAETLNTKGGNWFGILKVLRNHFPYLEQEYWKRFFQDRDFSHDKALFSYLAKKYKLSNKGFYTH